MNLPQCIHACRWLIWDTFRQSRASSVFWVMLAVTGVIVVFCLGVQIEGGGPLREIDELEVRSPTGHISVAFGAWRIQLFRDGQAQVHFLLLLLAEWVAGAGGTLSALIWTAGFLPDFLQPANAAVVLSKPSPRWVLLLGKFLGVLAFVGFQVAVFIVGTWLALGVRTGFWVNSYLWGIPLLVLHFASVYGFSVLLAVCTHNAAACLFGSIAFWLLCWGVSFGRHSLVALQSTSEPLHPVLRGLVEAGYWILPKPIDMGMILHRSMNADESFRTLTELQRVQELGAFSPLCSLATSLLFAAAMIFISSRRLSATDY